MHINGSWQLLSETELDLCRQVRQCGQTPVKTSLLPGSRENAVCTLQDCRVGDGLQLKSEEENLTYAMFFSLPTNFSVSKNYFLI